MSRSLVDKLLEQHDRAHESQSGRRVHYLANLGGLVVIAELDKLEPNLLMGILKRVQAKLATLSDEKKAALSEAGLQTLQARNAQKRSFSVWQREQNTTRFDLNKPQIAALIAVLDGKLPALEKDYASELWRLLGRIK